MEDDFNLDDFDADEPADDGPDPLRELLEKPLRHKARDIMFLTRALLESLGPGPESDPAEGIDEEAEEDWLYEVQRYMLEQAMLLGAKLASIGRSTDFGQRLETAVLIKRAACELQAQTALLRSFDRTPPEYLDALRAEIDEFRQLFRPWVASFDRTEHYDDGWGLFAPLLPPE